NRKPIREHLHPRIPTPNAGNFGAPQNTPRPLRPNGGIIHSKFVKNIREYLRPGLPTQALYTPHRHSPPRELAVPVITESKPVEAVSNVPAPISPNPVPVVINVPTPNSPKPVPVVVNV